MNTIPTIITAAVALVVTASALPNTVGQFLPTVDDVTIAANAFGDRLAGSFPQGADTLGVEVPANVAVLHGDILDTASAPPVDAGTVADLRRGLATVVAGGIAGLTGQVAELTGAGADTTTPDAPPASTETAAVETATSACRPGTAPAGDVDAALKVLTTTDTGTHGGLARWEQSHVTVTLVGTDVTPDAAAMVTDVLRWLSDTTGVHFTTGSHGDIVVNLSAGNRPTATAHVRDGAHQSAKVTWDPTRAAACRWAYEELAQATGAYGDWGPAGSVFSTDQSAQLPSAFDRWVLSALYAADTLTVENVTVALDRTA
jgi:hypothetical protein